MTWILWQRCPRPVNENNNAMILQPGAEKDMHSWSKLGGGGRPQFSTNKDGIGENGKMSLTSKWMTSSSMARGGNSQLSESLPFRLLAKVFPNSRDASVGFNHWADH